MFIGRKREMDTLERLYRSDRFEFVVLCGRRRVGKTALINRFLEDKRAIYFTGVESNARQNLDNLSRSLFEYSNVQIPGAAFPTYQAALEAVFDLAKEKRVIFVIDEYPYVARASTSLASTLQMLIDRYRDTSKLMLVLCGSSLSYMEDHVLAYKAPLYGRKTAQIKLLPFDFEEACMCFERYQPEEKALAYGLLGGTPQYLLQFDDGLSLKDNIINTFLNPSSSLFEEPINLIKQEVRQPAVYTALITAIATGSTRVSEMAGKVGEDANVCATYLKTLTALGLVRRETPYGESASRRSVYTIDDHMFRFWYRFIPDNASLIARGAADIVYNRIEPQLTDHMGKVFEDICTQYLWKLMIERQCPVTFPSLGRWWGNDPTTHSQTEIDIMGVQDKNTALFAECKWTSEKIDQSVLETLVHRSTLFPYRRAQLYLFGRSGFTKGCISAAKTLGCVTLVGFSDMTRAFHL